MSVPGLFGLLGPADSDRSVVDPLDLLDDAAVGPDLEEAVGDLDLEELAGVLTPDAEEPVVEAAGTGR